MECGLVLGGKIMKVDAIIFDLDGTLWNSTEAVLKAWDKVLEDSEEVTKPITKEEMEGVMGLQLPQIAEKLFPYLSKEKGLALLDSCCKLEQEIIRKEGGRLFDGLEDTLNQLKNKYKLFIVSNCQCGYIEVFLDHHKLGKYFMDTECAGNTGLSKGENIKRVMARSGIDAAVYVGDTQGDCDAARIANIPFVFASYGFGKVSSYEYVLDELKNITKLF